MPLSNDSRARSLAPLLAAAVAYAAAVVYLSWPLATALATRLVDPLKLPAAGGVWGRADLDLLVWILAWTAHALVVQPLDLFQANIFHPAPDTLASSENLLGLAPLSAPLFWATHNAVLTYNVSVLVVVWLAALCTFALVRAWSGSAAAAFLAGATFALGPQLTGSWIRLHCSAVHFFPLVLLLAWCAARAPRRSTLLLLALVTALQLLAGIYVAFELVLLLVAFVPALVLEARRHGKSGLAPLAALAAGALALAVIAPAYLRVRAAGTLPDLSDAIAHVALTSPPPRLVLDWLATDATLPLLGLALVGLIAGRCALDLRLALLVATALGVILSAGTTLPLVPGTSLPSAFEILMRTVPGFSGMRSSSRFLVVPLLAIAVLAGLGAARLIDLASARFAAGGRRLAAGLACVAALLVVALRAPQAALPLVDVPLAGYAYAAHAWLREHGEHGAVLEIPAMNSSMDGSAVLATGRAMLGSTLHFLPLLNGYSGHPPAASGLIMTLAQRLPDRDAFAALCALAEPQWIIVRSGLLHDGHDWAGAVQQLGLEPAAHFGRDTIYRSGAACGAVSGEAGIRRDADRERTLTGVALRPLEPSATRGTIAAATVPGSLLAGSFTWLWLDVHNGGSVTLPGMIGSAPGSVMVQSRWRDPRTGAIVASGETTPLAIDLEPGRDVRAQVGIAAPKAPGDYLLEIGLLQSGQGWIGETTGELLLRRPLTVTMPG